MPPNGGFFAWCVDKNIMTAALRTGILNALIAQAEGEISKAKMNIEVYLNNPVGIGEHPDVLGSIQDQIDVIAESQERLDVLYSLLNDN